MKESQNPWKYLTYSNVAADDCAVFHAVVCEWKSFKTAILSHIHTQINKAITTNFGCVLYKRRNVIVSHSLLYQQQEENMNTDRKQNKQFIWNTLSVEIRLLNFIFLIRISNIFGAKCCAKFYDNESYGYPNQ